MPHKSTTYGDEAIRELAWALFQEPDSTMSLDEAYAVAKQAFIDGIDQYADEWDAWVNAAKAGVEEKRKRQQAA